MENQVKLDREWLHLLSDGYEIRLMQLPQNIIRKKIFHVNNRLTERIGYRRLSADNTKVAFTWGTFGNTKPNDGLFIVDVLTGDTKKIVDCPSGTINLIGFVGNGSVLLSGHVTSQEDILSYEPKAPDQFAYLYLYNFEKNQLQQLSNLGSATVGMSNGITSLSSFAFETGESFKVYNFEEKKTSEIIAHGELFAISPDGKRVLFFDYKKGYCLVDKDGQNEQIVISLKKLNSLKPLFLGYFELKYYSWSSDGLNILFNESSDEDKGRKYLLDLRTNGIKQL
ncbi:MAG: PD40 domain-containing protein [Candidatus Omnitrophica bacterium]|nr:PD40 domain-containing protein [Candidatus Omnitrophota bacterium]